MCTKLFRLRGGERSREEEREKRREGEGGSFSWWEIEGDERERGNTKVGG
jgi:hypothetical protein